MSRKLKKLSPILKDRLSLIPEDISYNYSHTPNQSSQHFLYQQMKRKIRNKSKSTKSNFVVVRSQEQQLLMDNLRPRIKPLMSPTNSITISDYLKMKSIERSNQEKRRSRSTFMIHKPEKKARNTQLDSILDKKQQFKTTYFQQLKQFHKKPKNCKLKQQVSYRFPQVYVNGWEVKGFLRGNFVLLKGSKDQDNHLPAKQKFKKYPYQQVRNKIRNNYEQWVNDRFCFQN